MESTEQKQTEQVKKIFTPQSSHKESKRLKLASSLVNPELSSIKKGQTTDSNELISIDVRMPSLNKVKSMVLKKDKIVKPSLAMMQFRKESSMKSVKLMLEKNE
jgi:hypothetical protein